MDALFRWRYRDKPEGMDSLERALSETLKPVLPTRDYVHDLQLRLLEQAHSSSGVSRANLFQYIFLSSAALLSASVLVLTGVRVVLAVAGAIGLIYHQIQGREKSPVGIRSR